MFGSARPETNIYDLRMNNQARAEEFNVFLQQCKKGIGGQVDTKVDDRWHDSVLTG